MKDRKDWVKALQIDPSEVNKWLEEVPSPDVLTFWSLDRGKINAEKYFEWAKDYYGLAYLKSDFFKMPANTTLWGQLESVANWSPQMIPVHEWDGVIFVACVEPALEIQWSFPVQYVLATPQDLKTHWEALNSAEPVAAPAPDELLQDTPAPEETPIEESAEAPEGIKFEDDIATSPGDSPIGLSDEPPAAPVLQLDNLMPVQDEAPAPESPAPEEPKVPSTPPPPSNYDAGTSTYEVTKVAGILDHLKADFEGSMLLMMEADQLKPFVWDSNWKPKANPEGPGNLKDASAFRVVTRTKHPYLGHVVDTPVNRGFFKAWSIEEFPEKILVQPITESGNIIAVLVSICNPGVKNQVLLSAGTKHANEIARMLQDDSSQASAA